MASQAYIRLARHVPAAAAAATTFAASWQTESSTHPTAARCDASPPPVPSSSTTHQPYDGMLNDATTSKDDSFHGLFPKRQLWQPRVEYPLWDNDWDGRQPPSTGDPNEDRRRMRQVRKEGVTRHIILIRHGQYDEESKEDDQRKLTPLGRQQADLTGRRLRELMEAAADEDGFSSCNLKVLRVSDMARAKETADIIASHLPGVERSDPDPDLNEGRPAHNVPGGKASSGAIEKVDEQHPRIEAAFRRYFYRWVEDEEDEHEVDGNNSDYDDDDADEQRPKHEFEVIVCHANVIRYFLCRALQIPPEAWLRLCTFNCSLTYLTIRPTGSVSCRMLGDIGHLPYNKTTFSMHPGFNW